VIGRIDSHNRALIDLAVANQPESPLSTITAWIDTAFDGFLVLSLHQIHDLKLEQLAKTEAILADGTVAVFDTFLCYVNWFDILLPIQVMANDGKFPLLGTGLLEKRRLVLDYVDQTVSLD
jgi:clan AA aspartic protease